MIEFRALGAVDLRRRDGAELLSVLSQPKRTALFAYLLLARPRGFHRRDLLVALFWPESDAEHGRNSLRQAVYFLRRSLGDDVVESRGEEDLGIPPGSVWCDAHAFEEALDRNDAGKALSLYEGELLPGFFVEGAPEFERWLDSERARLRGRAVRAACDLAQARERAGDTAGAAELGARALELAPDDEGLLRAQMQRLARHGDRARALSAYDGFAERLSAEYELEPEPESQALAAEIRTAHPSAAGPAAALGATPQILTAAPPPDVPAPAPPPVGTTASAPPSPAPRPEETSPIAPAAVSPARRPRRRLGWRQALLAAIALLAVGGIVVGGWLVLRRPRETNGRRVVVAAFENRTGDAALGPLSDMAADWITQGLTQTGIVDVVDAPTALTVAREARLGTTAGGPDVVRLFSRQTGAGLVITGRFYRQADSLAFVAQVVDARTRRVVRAIGPLSAPRTDPVQGADRLRRRLMAELAVLLDDRLARFQALEQPPSYEAYREYMEGLAGYLVYDRKAADHFVRAFALDSTFYRALLWAAQSMWAADDDDPIARYDTLFEQVELLRARLTPAEQHQLDFAMAVRAVDFRAAYAAARLRLEASPGSDDALRELMLSAERVQHLREAAELSARADVQHSLLSRSVEYRRSVGRVQHQRGDLEGELRTGAEWARQAPESLHPEALRLEALAALGRVGQVRSLASRLADRLADHPEIFAGGAAVLPSAASAVAPFEIGARELNAHGKPVEARALALEGLARCEARAPNPALLRPESRMGCIDLLAFVGRWRDVDGLLRQVQPPGGLRPAYLRYAGMAAARLGDQARARAFSDSLALVAIRTKGDVVAAPSVEFERATIAAALGDREDALRRLRLWRAAGDWIPEKLHSEPIFVPYFEDPRFRKLLESED